jgi:hypothetical protein
MNARTFSVPILAALLAALTLGACVAGWASSASAACAWVLWRIDPDARHVTMDAYEAKNQCDEERQRLNEKAADVVNRGGGLYGFICLPDTVDSRGPKGGMR